MRRSRSRGVRRPPVESGDASGPQAVVSATRAFASAEGIPLAGVAPLEPLEPEGSRLRQWVGDGFSGDLGYMGRTAEIRADPTRREAFRRGARGAIVLGVPYDRRPPLDAGARAIAAYARGRDYHRVLRSILRRLAARLREVDPGISLRPFCDTAAVMDKAVAVRAGLGWQGRNTLVIHPEYGSTFVIGGVLIDRVPPRSERIEERCGECRQCVDACPSGALAFAGVLDARRCVSSWTTHGRVPPADLPRGSYSFGCDICQDVCPFNAGPGPEPYPGFGR